MSITSVFPPTAERPSGAQRDWLRLSLLAGALAFNIIPIFRFVGSMIWFREYLGDYQVFWGIGSLPIEHVYDHRIVAYPPSALLLIRPFALLPFWSSLIAWSALGAAALIVAARRAFGPVAIGLGFVTYAGVGVLLGGQISLFIAALVIAGLACAAPRWQGLFLGTAAVIKPQSLLAAPVALIAQRRWRTIAWSMLFGGALLLLSAAAFGFDLWVRWIVEMPRFHAYLVDHRIDRLDVGLYGLFRSLGLPGGLFVIGIPLGIWTSWRVFRSNAPLLDRYAAFAASTVLMSPYTLYYDLAGLTFASMAMLLDRRRSALAWTGAALIVSSVFAALGIVILAVVLCSESGIIRGERVGASTASSPR